MFAPPSSRARAPSSRPGTTAPTALRIALHKLQTLDTIRIIEGKA